ncbi:MAG: Protease HtpX [Myxococcota bacterium]|nr:Protease HtpX [Myxococcota bacterium]
MWELVRRNQIKSLWLVVFMGALLILTGWAAGEWFAPGSGAAGVAIAGFLAVILFLISYFAGGDILLALAGARQVEKQDAPQLYNIVEEMRIASGLQAMPRMYIMDSPAANAFAAGRNPEESVVAVTEGLLRICNREELQGVIAHEMAHIKHRDILFMTLLAVMAGAISIIADFMSERWWLRSRISSRDSDDNKAAAVVMILGLVLIIFGALAARLIWFAASRTREYLADAGAAVFTRNPEGLASALEKISSSIAGHELPVPKVAQAMLIAGANLFSTHPPMANRINILRQLAGGGQVSYQAYAMALRAAGGRSGMFPAAALKEPALPIASLTQRERGTPPPANLRRETLDAARVRAGYRMHACECGAKIKIPARMPPGLSLSCPVCGRPVRSGPDRP